MSDDNDMMRGSRRAVRIKQTLSRLQSLSKLRGAFKDRLAGRIKKKPRLIMLENFRVRAKVIGHVLPRNRRRDQAMNEQDRNLVGIVRMNQVDASSDPWIVGSEEGCCGASCHFSGVRIEYR